MLTSYQPAGDLGTISDDVLIERALTCWRNYRTGPDRDYWRDKLQACWAEAWRRGIQERVTDAVGAARKHK